MNPQQQVQQILAGQFAPLDFAFQRANAQAARQQASLNAARRQLVAQLQRGVGPAGAYYSQGVQQQQALANAAGDALAHANPDATIQANLAAIGAPQAQRQQLAAQSARDYAGQAAVLGTIQGAIPGAGLIAGRSAARQFAAGLPTVAALSGEQSLRQLAGQEAQTRDKYLEGRLQIAGQGPQLLQQLQAAQAEAAYRAQKDAEDQAYRAAQLALSQQRIDVSRAGQQGSAQGKKASAEQKRQAGFYSTRSKAFAQARKLYGTEVPNKDQPAAGAGGIGTSGSSLLAPTGTPKTVKHRRYSRGGAYNVLYSTYAPQLIAQGFKPATVQQMIDKALHTAGYPLADRTPAAGPTRSKRKRRRTGQTGTAPTLYETGNPLIPLYGG